MELLQAERPQDMSDSVLLHGRIADSFLEFPVFEEERIADVFRPAYAINAVGIDISSGYPATGGLDPGVNVAIASSVNLNDPRPAPDRYQVPNVFNKLHTTGATMNQDNLAAKRSTAKLYSPCFQQLSRACGGAATVR